MKETFAGRLRVAAISAGKEGSDFTVDDLVDAMGVQTRDEKKRVWESIRDFVRYGEWERVGKGTYRITGKPRSGKPAEKRVVMWRYLRMKRQRGEPVTIEDLAEISGAGTKWASEWLGGLVRNGVVRDHGNGRYQLIRDTVAMPVVDEKAAKLRELRQRRRDAIKEAVERGRQMLSCLAEAIDVDSQMDAEG